MRASGLLRSPTRTSQDKPILNIITGAVGAYGITRLNYAYNEAAIRVRRSNDNAELDVGFSNSGIDLSTLTNFVGNNSAFIKTWYDQSGNNNNAIQTNSDNQLLLINNGILEELSYFDGSNYHLEVANSTSLDITTAPMCVSAVIKPNNTSGYIISKSLESLATVQYGFLHDTSTLQSAVRVVLNGTAVCDSGVNTVPNNVYSHVAFTWDGTNVKLYVNNILKITAPYSGTLTSRPYINIGCRSNNATNTVKTSFYKGYTDSLFVFNTISDVYKLYLDAKKKYPTIP